MRERTCATCKWLNKPRSFVSTNGFQCRRFPPAHSFAPDDEPRWPRVGDKGHWCGEWEAKKE